jgi:hypothetical protein
VRNGTSGNSLEDTSLWDEDTHKVKGDDPVYHNIHVETCTLLWHITQRMVVIPYRRFGITYRSRFPKVKKSFGLGFLDP